MFESKHLRSHSIPRTPIPRLRRNMAKATDKKRREPREEAIPKYGDFMPRVGLKRLRRAYKSERPGKPQIILRACELRKKGMGIRPIMRKLQQAYSTVRDWLLRMMDADLDRRHDKQRGRKKKKLDAAARKAILEWIDNSPRKYGFAAGTWQLAMILVMLERELNIECKPRTLRRVMKRTKCSYTKARPVPRKSATKEEREEFVSEANATLEELMAQDYVVLCGDEAGVLRWNGGGYGWRRTGGRYTVKSTFSKQSVKMFGALGKDGFYMRPADALNSETFIEFLKELQQTYPKFAMILDNAGYHKSLMVSRFIGSTGGDVKLIYLPPYTPQLNPIEVQWRVLKRLLAGRYFEGVDELRDAIVQIVQNEMKAVEIKVCAT